MKIDFNEPEHEYRVDGQLFPSVTTTINDLLPYRFPVDDWYLERGRAVHACAAMIGRGQKFKHDDRIEGQVGALYKFFNEIKPDVILIETKVASTLYRFAGTFDLLTYIENKKCLLDYKSSLDENRTALQLAGYAIALEEMNKVKIKWGCGVEIKENGKYKMSKIINLTNYKREFLALRAVYAIRERMNYHN